MNRSQLVFLGGLLIVAANFRPAVTSVSPILETIRASLGLSYTMASLLTTIPSLCMGGFALAVPAIGERIGRERVVFWGVVLIAFATAARLGGRNVLVLFGSTILVGVGIAVTQAILPSLVSEYFPTQESFVTGLYAASLSVGAALAGAATAPLASLLNSWPAALASWALLAGIAVPLWVVSWHRISSRGTNVDTASTQARIPWRSRWAWVLTLFFGCSSMSFFFVLTWLAPRYVELGWSVNRAGLLLSAFVLAQLGGNLTVSAIGDRLGDQRPLFVLMVLLVLVGALGVSFVPRAVPWVWALLLGAGTAGLFTLGLVLPVTYTNTAAATDGLTSMMLGGGYLIASLGPFLGGAILDLTGQYSVTFVALVCLGIVLLSAVTLFSPDRGPVRVNERSDEG